MCSGPGEQGRGHRLLAAVSGAEVDKRRQEEGMNILVSDEIALDRSLKDIRKSGLVRHQKVQVSETSEAAGQ